MRGILSVGVCGGQPLNEMEQRDGFEPSQYYLLTRPATTTNHDHNTAFVNYRHTITRVSPRCSTWLSYLRKMSPDADSHRWNHSHRATQRLLLGGTIPSLSSRSTLAGWAVCVKDGGCGGIRTRVQNINRASVYVCIRGEVSLTLHQTVFAPLICVLVLCWSFEPQGMSQPLPCFGFRYAAALAGCGNATILLSVTI